MQHVLLFSIFAPLLLPKIKISNIKLRINSRTGSYIHTNLTAVAKRRNAIHRDHSQANIHSARNEIWFL